MRAGWGSVVPCLWGLLAAFSIAACAGGADSAPASNRDGATDSATSATGGASASDGGLGSGGSVGAGSGGAVGSGGTGTGGSTVGSGGASGAGGAATSGCAVQLSLPPPQVEGNLESGAKARVSVRADLYRAGPKTPVWSWTVVYQPSAAVPYLAMPDPIQPNVATADFPVAQPGTYKVSLSVDSGIVCSTSMNLQVTAPQPASYIVRVTPPISPAFNAPVQDTRIILQQVMQNPRGVMLSLRQGTRRSISVKGPDGAFVPAYVRVSVVPSGAVLDGYTARGPIDVLALPATTYDLLVVPDGDIAPLRLSTSFDVNRYNPLPMDAGTAVRGALLNSDGGGIAGARIVLRDGNVPSTIGVSDAAGRFVLWARPGNLSAVVVPPAALGWAEARVSGIPLNASVTDVTMIWQPVVRGTLSVSVKAVGGAAPAPGARVRLEPDRDAERVVASLRVSGGVVTTLSASGAVRAEAFTNASGVATFGRLPQGAYRLTVVPPPEMPEAALTTKAVTLTSAGLSETVVLARHLVLTGKLLPNGGTKGVRVIARDTSAGVAAPTATAIADENGAYVLSLDPERIYTLFADPPPGLKLARTVLGKKNLVSADGTAPDYTVSRGVPVPGVVTADGMARPVTGAMVQLFCVDTARDCLDPDWPLAEAVTDQNGAFTVSLPAPQVR